MRDSPESVDLVLVGEWLPAFVRGERASSNSSICASISLRGRLSGLDGVTLGRDSGLNSSDCGQNRVLRWLYSAVRCGAVLMHLLTHFDMRLLGQEFPQSVQRTRLPLMLVVVISTWPKVFRRAKCCAAVGRGTGGGLSVSGGVARGLPVRCSNCTRSHSANRNCMYLAMVWICTVSCNCCGVGAISLAPRSA